MSEKTEWELVDTPQPNHGGDNPERGARAGVNSEQGKTSTNVLQAMLGRWWQLKLLGAGVAAVVAFALLLMIGGVLVLTISILAALSWGIARMVSWLRGKQLAHRTHITQHNR
ncbi:hypothetical protein RY831_17275 [Noviherbaspirillum sp. CPCC 100848]|uniref:Transmembrane protein n=1 Tax=Noviherbaspirillum album TaxID=3080276 RepID=A0ABU6JB88_9BURK|nr:hypothetical protein [Noviherbaspirillum sp. CPCC 100848]MEC4720920.1 hypothetical protein [Noviherbaspirillum sp. CPCC 100848]